MYSVKEVYYTLQGEGAHTGRAAVFLRFAGCNLWTGREQDRHKAVCQFCDTDFVGTDGPGGDKFAGADELAAAVEQTWLNAVDADQRRYVVCTGGEPLLQLDESAVKALQNRGFEVGVETNGTQVPPEGLDWICMSPKAGTELRLRHGNELKLVYPQQGAMPELFEDLDFQHFFLQPMDGPETAENTAAAVDFCLKNPRWRLSVQTHKVLGLA
jgi:7-carboxy-7-deazaguanine synthase